MLVLSRRKDDATEIYTPTGVTIKLVIVDVIQEGPNRYCVKLGIDAPYEYNIVRDNAKVRVPK